MVWRWAAVAAFLATSWPQDLPPEVILLARLKARMKQELAQMPNVTCVETVERFHKSASQSAKLKPIDTLKLEVAEIGGREVYSRLGERDFHHSDVKAFIGNGMIASGMFASDLRSVFLTNQATISYSGKDELGGKPVERYAFHIPLFRSGFTIESGGASGIASLRGSFWVDPGSLDLLRLEHHAEDIRPEALLSEVTSVVDYARIRVGDREVLLPHGGAFEVTELSGEQNRDVVRFTNCRSFQAESAIRYDAGPEIAAPATPPETVEALPAGLVVPVRLAVALTDATVAGEAITGTVAGDVRSGGRLLISDGTLIRGRVRRLERHSEPVSYFLVALDFNEIDVNGAVLRFYADLQGLDESAGVLAELRKPESPGVGTFVIRGSGFKLPPGFRMTWRTRELK